MRSSVLSFALSFSTFLASTLALKVVPSSPCAPLCGNVTVTRPSDIVCTDGDYSNTAIGQTFQQCISCQANSTAVDAQTGDSDLKWVLYNLRFAASSCLFGFGGNNVLGNNPCMTSRACGVYQRNVELNNLTTYNTGTFDFCANMALDASEQRCVSCLASMGAEYYLANFFTALFAACTVQSSPTLPVDSTLFQQKSVNIRYTIAPTAPATAPSAPSGPLTLGAKVGIVVGGIIFLLVIAGVTIICCGKRRRRRNLAERVRRMKEYEPPFGPRSPTRVPVRPKWATKGDDEDIRQVGTAHSEYAGDSKHGFSPYTSETESPVTYPSDKVAFSPYSSQYSSPVSAREGLLPSQSWDWKLHSKDPSGGQDQAYEMDKVRMHDKVVEDQRRQEEWMNEGAQKGYTATPLIRPPAASKTRGSDYV